MSTTYWKAVGDSVAKGLGEKTLGRLGVGGKILGRTGAVLGAGFLVYELFKHYKDNIEREPAYVEMEILQREMAIWTSAISCLGREPFEETAFGSFDEGGAINALYRKRGLGGTSVKAADPEEAHSLIGRSIDYIQEVDNLSGDSSFAEERDALVSRLKVLQDRLAGSDDYVPIQKELGRVVDEIRPILSGYASRVYDCSREIQKTLGSNAAWAAISMTTLGMVKKP